MRARIIDPDLGVICGCSIVNLSGDGAKLELDEPVDMPWVIWVKIDNDAELRYCEVKWQNNCELGVEFTLEKYSQAAQEEAKTILERMVKTRHRMSWGKLDRRSGQDRRAGSDRHVNDDKRSRKDRRAGIGESPHR